MQYYFGYQQINNNAPEASEPEAHETRGDAVEAFERVSGYGFTMGPYASLDDARQHRDRMIAESGLSWAEVRA